MGTTLTGTTPQDTYDSLIKVTDNGPLSATAKRLSDGLGNDSTLYLSTTSVGIGVASPVETLEVGGTTIVKSGSGTTVLAVADTSTGGKQYSLISAGTGNVHSVPTGSFYIRNSSDGVTAMTLTSAGNVGIGTSSPDGKLDVASAGNLVSTGAFTNPHIALTLTASPVDNDTFAGITFPTSDSANYGWSLGAKRETGGNGFLEIRQHFNSATGTQIARFTGNGLCFGSDTAAANALDDYEEGTWTIGVSFGGSSTGITYANNTGTYTKIGRQVTVNGYLLLSSKGSSVGNATITGLPFTIANSNTNSSAATLWTRNISFLNVFQAIGTTNSTNITLWEVTTGGALTSLDDVNFANDSDIIISFTYFV